MSATTSHSRSLPAEAETLLERAAGGRGPLLWLTGAGISAESGIPTFRGKEGYWRVGSRNYHPQDLATYEAFTRLPDDAWSWYLYRRAVCRGAEPNAAHLALADLERRSAEAGAGERFLLVTQNVDGLHLRAGSSLDRTYQIHGNIDFMRCSRECTGGQFRIPEEVDPGWEKGRALGERERELLVCPECGARARPHVLWFDEFYDEDKFRFDSAMRAAAAADLLVVVGTAGVTNLPLQMGAMVARRGAPLLAVNLEPSPFTELADRSDAGCVLEGKAGEWVPVVAERLGALLQG